MEERLLLFRRFSAPKAKMELKLDEVAYEYTDKLSGKIVIDPEEEICTDELRLEFSGSKKSKFKKEGSSRFSSFEAKPSHIGISVGGQKSAQLSGSSESLEAKTIHVSGPVTLQKGQHYEVPFKIDIPRYSRSDPFIEIEIKVKGVVATKGRPDLTHEVKPVINFPYVVECSQKYGGCGFTTPPLAEPPRVCPKCGNNLEEVWNRKYSEESDRIQQGSLGPQYYRKRG